MKPPCGVAIEVIGEPLYGEWCSRCFLPSGIEMLLTLTSVGRTSTVMVRRCVDCGEPL